MMIELTLEKAFKLAKSFVEPNPDFIYKDENGWSGRAANCQYIHSTGTKDEKPGCIIGFMFDALGVERSKLIKFDDNSHTASQAMGLLRKYGEMSIDQDAFTFIDCLQRQQDAGYSWGDSLKYAAGIVGIDYQG
jgi:hypothetical protein